MMDASTFNQLKESYQYHPEITEVIYGWDKLMGLSLNAVEICQKGFDSVWDAQFLSFLLNNFKEGFSIGRRSIKTRGIRSRFVIDFTQANIGSFDLYDLGEFRHLDGIRGNFGIMDSRCYMVFILMTDNQPPNQGVFSNFKPLVEIQQRLFEELWNMGMPLSSRIKELEYQDNREKNQHITNYEEISDEANYLLDQTRKELLVFSTTTILYQVMTRDNHRFLSSLVNLLKKETIIKIIVDNFDEQLVKAIDLVNTSSQNNNIQFGYSNKLGDFNEMIILSDSKHLFHLNYSQDSKLVAYYSKEKHQIFVQELMFEKYWNEIISLGN